MIFQERHEAAHDRIVVKPPTLHQRVHVKMCLVPQLLVLEHVVVYNPLQLTIGIESEAWHRLKLPEITNQQHDNTTHEGIIASHCLEDLRRLAKELSREHPTLINDKEGHGLDPTEDLRALEDSLHELRDRSNTNLDP